MFGEKLQNRTGVDSFKERVKNTVVNREKRKERER